MLVISSTRFGSMMASTSPRRSPAAANTAATASTRSAKAALSSTWRSSAMQGSAGVPLRPLIGNFGCCHGTPLPYEADASGRPRAAASCAHHKPGGPSVVLRATMPGRHRRTYAAVTTSPEATRMTRLINIDNGGTLTDFCFVDGGEVRYTKTLTTPIRPEPVPVRRPGQGLRAGLRRAAARRAAAEHGLHPVLHHPGHQRPGAADRAAAWPARHRPDAGRRAGGHPGPGGPAGRAGR